MLPSQSLKFSRPLWKHQADALDRFAASNEVALFHEQGCGKTTTAVAWLRSKFVSKQEITKTLIICPIAVLYNWQREFDINASPQVVESILVPYMRTKRTKYTGIERATLIQTTQKKIVILNGESLDNQAVVTALQIFKPTNIILDESHKFKNPKLTSISRLGKLLSISDYATNRMILTGTPILNSYLDLWAQYRIMDGGKTFGTNFWVFRATYFEDKNAGWSGQPKYFPNWMPKPNAHEILSKLLGAKASRLKKTECLDLPPLVHTTHYVEMSPEQSKAYYAMENELVAEVQLGTCAATNALSQVMRLLQILSGHLPVENETQRAKITTYFRQNPRLEALRELVEELTGNHKVIIWATFEANYAQIRGMLRELNIPHAELVGGTKDRQGEIDRFQLDPKCRVMLSNPQAGGTGVNLVAASYMIYFSRSYSLGDRLQSESRAHRGGSEIHEKITLIDLVVKDTLDEVVLAALLRKENFSEKVLSTLKER